MRVLRRSIQWSLTIKAIRSWLRSNPLVNVLLWPILATLIVGAVDFGEPVETILRAGRDALRSHASDGAVAVVKIDDKSFEAYPDWATRRARTAQIADALFALGAKRIVFNTAFSERSSFGDDRVLADLMARHPRRIILGVKIDYDRSTHQQQPLLPIPVLRRDATLGVYNLSLLWHIGINDAHEGHFTVRASQRRRTCEEVESGLSDRGHARLRRWPADSFFSAPLP